MLHSLGVQVMMSVQFLVVKVKNDLSLENYDGKVEYTHLYTVINNFCAVSERIL